MRILGIETSGDVVSLAALDGSGLRSELAFRHEMQLSQYLVPRIEGVLEFGGLEFSEVEGLAVCIGPGSFTGLRIGVTTAKTLAYARSLPVSAVSSLAALAAEARAPAEALVCALISASASDLFAALYQWVDGRLEPRAEEMLLPAAEMVEKLATFPGPVYLAGSPGDWGSAIAERLERRLVWAWREASPRAATVARLGRERLLEGSGIAPHDLAPRYLRPSAAEARRQGLPT